MKIFDRLMKENKQHLITQFLSLYNDPSVLNVEVEDDLTLKDIVEILNLLIFKKEYLEQEQKKAKL